MLDRAWWCEPIEPETPSGVRRSCGGCVFGGDIAIGLDHFGDVLGSHLACVSAYAGGADRRGLNRIFDDVAHA